MKTVCLLFEIHQPFRLKKYRFYDIGADHYYFDDYSNEEIMKRNSYQSYLPATKMLLEMINASNKAFKVALSISGVALEQFENYCPELLDSIRDLVNTGCCELTCEPYGHSLSSMIDPETFEIECKIHDKAIFDNFGYRPKVFTNTGFIYNDDIGAQVAAMGYKGVITEGAKHVLGWKSPNYVYNTTAKHDVKLLFRNLKLSEDIALNFQGGLDANTYMRWIAESPESEQVYVIAMNFDVIGGIHPASTGIFEFFKALPKFAAEKGITFSTPSEVCDNVNSVDTASIGHYISWDGFDKDTSAWTGNDLQREAQRAIYSISERLHLCRNRILQQDFLYLLSADHFKFMSTKNGSFNPFSPYESSFDAFTNFMNVVSDMQIRMKQQFPEEIENEELNPLLKQIENQGKEIEKLETKLEKSEAEVAKLKEAKKVAAAKAKTTAAKATKKSAPAEEKVEENTEDATSKDEEKPAE